MKRKLVVKFEAWNFSKLQHFFKAVYFHAMYLRGNQFEALARFILREIGGSEKQIAVILQILEENQQEENQLLDDSQKLLDQHKRKLGEQIDEEKALGMIKKQLAKERGFVF